MKEYKNISINDKWLKLACTQYPEKTRGSVMALVLRDSIIGLKVCSRCKQAISRQNKSGMCRVCYNDTLKRAHVPSRIILENDSELTVSEMAKKYGVSPGTISNWLKFRGIRRNSKI